jgi:Flp pilus assembly protein TadB
MFILAWYMSPAHAGKLMHTSSGLKLLATAFGLQMLGLWSIKKITTVRV